MSQTLVMSAWTESTPFPESEPVIVNTDPSGQIVLEFDGRLLAFDAREFRAAVNAPSLAEIERVL